MKNTNTKELLAFTFKQMEKLDAGEIDTEHAREQANLIKQANNIFKYELDRAKVKMDLANHNSIHSDELDLRDIEKGL